MSKYANVEHIKKVIREEWVKYMPLDLDINLSFVLGKISEVPTIEVGEDCDNCIWNTCNYNKVPWEVGEWINKQEKYQMAECSNCKKVTMHEMWGDKLVYYDYCPNCGCAMTNCNK